MDAVIEEKEIKFIPGCDKDCFDLGAFGQKIPNKTRFTTGGVAYKMDYLSVFITDVIRVLIDEK